MNSLNILKKAQKNGVIDEQQLEKLSELFQNEMSQPNFNFTNMLYYFGGSLAIGALFLILSIMHEFFGELGLMGTSIVLFIIGIFTTKKFTSDNNFYASSVCSTFTLFTIPLFIVSTQAYLNIIEFGEIDNFTELSTFLLSSIACSIYFYFNRYPFSMLPLTFLYYATFLHVLDVYVFLDNLKLYSERDSFMLVGGIFTFLGLLIDCKKSRIKDYAFWLYVLGFSSFWISLSLKSGSTELETFIYFLMNLLFLVFGAMINRKIFSIFGAFGIIYYIVYLAYDLFENSLLFPIVLIILGFLLIFIGNWWKKNHRNFINNLTNKLPLSMISFLDRIKL